MSDVAVIVIAALGTVVLAGAAFYMFGRRIERRLGEAAGKSVEQQAQRLLENAQRGADAAKAEAILAGKEEVIVARQEWERDEKRRREEISRIERRVDERETHLDKKGKGLDDRETDLQRRDESVRDKERHLDQREQEVTETLEKHRQKLEQ
ncbi:MAG: Rnase Y domain-containing protein, partial [Gemmatimonadales bacterium]